jgi:hypothetical protein
MTPRKRVEVALAGGHADKVPFTMYESMIPQCTVERDMRNRGLCIVHRKVQAVKRHHPNVKICDQRWNEDGKALTRSYFETPHGTLTRLDEKAGFTSWHHEKMWKSPDDYKALLFFIQDVQFEPNYEAFAAAEAWMGEDVICRTGLGMQPLQGLITGRLMGMEDFCIEWMERRDEILKLYDALVHNQRKLYPLVAASPASHANYGGNLVSAIVSPQMYREYYLPHYHEAAEVMHKAGKYVGSHYDGNCGPLAEVIAADPLDYIEAFTPAPDSDMTLAEARAAWPEKVLWLNFPSSLHLRPAEEVAAAAFDLVEQAGPDGLIVGITEDMPGDRWRETCPAIMDGLDRHAAGRPERYA